MGLSINFFNNKSRIILALSFLIFFIFTIVLTLLSKSFNGFVAHITQVCKNIVSACFEAVPFFSSLIYLPTPTGIIMSALFLFIGFGLIRLLLSIAFIQVLKLRHNNLKLVNSKRVDNAYQRSSILNCKPSVFESPKPFAYTYGLFRPKVYISTKAVEMLDDEELEAVLLHEAAHVSRKDNIQITFMAFIKDVLFFLPISNLLFKLFSREKEHEADDFAVSRRANAFGLASAIVKMSKSKTCPSLPLGAMAFSESKIIEDRVKRLISRSYKPSLYTKKFIMSFMVSTIILLSLFALGFSFSKNNNTAATGCNMALACSSMDSTNCPS